MKQNQLVVVFIIVLIIACAGSFYGGIMLTKSKNSMAAFGPGGQGQRFGGAGGDAAGRRNGVNGSLTNFVNGDILSKDSASVTVKMRDGGSKIIFFSSTTEIGKFASGTFNDLAVGTSIMVNGKSNTDGSIAAQSIQIRPTGMLGGPGSPLK